MNQKERQKLKKKCDALWSKVTKILWAKKYGHFCPWCKNKFGVQSDHIANRWKHSTRWRVENCVVLCMPCHIFRKKREPAEWANMVIETIGRELYDEIISESKKVVHEIDYEEICRYLQAAEREAREPA